LLSKKHVFLSSLLFKPVNLAPFIGVDKEIFLERGREDVMPDGVLGEGK